MSSAGFQPGDKGRGEFYKSSDAHTPSVLDEAIRKTIASWRPQESVSKEEFNALKEVARRHQDKALELEPVVVDLVDALLKLHFAEHPNAHSGASPPDVHSRREMSREIATSLFDAPESQQRLHSLWAKLLEAVK